MPITAFLSRIRVHFALLDGKEYGTKRQHQPLFRCLCAGCKSAVVDKKTHISFPFAESSVEKSVKENPEKRRIFAFLQSFDNQQNVIMSLVW